MPDLSTVGKRLEFARSQKGLLQKDLAKVLGMKNTTQISQWESDVYTPNAHRLADIAAALDVSAIWLISGTGNPPSAGRSHGDGVEEVFPISTLMRQPTVRAWLNAFQSELIARGASPEQEDSVMRTVADRDLIARFAGGGPDDQYTVDQVQRAMENIALAARRFLQEPAAPPRTAKLEEPDIPAERPSTKKQTGDRRA